MPQQSSPDNSLDDVQVLGPWNFTLQGDTPLYWLKTGQLDRYLMKLRIHSPCPGTAGIVLHAEVDGPGTDGASFWMERRPAKDGKEGTRRYMLAGDGLDSKPIVTRAYPDVGGELVEEIEVLMEGYHGTIILQDRTVKLRFRVKSSKGALAFYNSTQGDNDDVHFSNVRITALRRGPLEVGGKLLETERKMDRLNAEGKLPAAKSTRSPMKQKGSFGGFGSAESRASTMLPDSRSHMASTFSLGGGNTWGGSDLGSPSQSQFGGTPHGRTQMSSTMSGGRSTQTPGRKRLQFSASDSTLRNTGTFLGGTSPKPFGAREKFMPLALNAPSGEQQLLKSVSRPAPSSKACTDFIAL